MKKLLSLTLCLCILAGGLSVFVVPASATIVQTIPNASDIPEMEKRELIYSEDFQDNSLDTSKKNAALISELGWFGTLGSSDSLSIVSNGKNRAVSVTAYTTRLDTFGFLRDDRLKGGNYILEYTVYLADNYLDDPERTFGFCSESATTFKQNKNTAWRFVLKEDGTSDHHLKINANAVSDQGNSLLVSANDGVSSSLIGSTYRVRVVVDAEFGVSAYLLDGENATLISATTPGASSEWKKYSSTIGNELRFHILSGITATFDDIQVWTAKKVEPAMKLIGYQTTPLRNDTYDIRFIAGVKNLDASYMGFKIDYTFERNGATVRDSKTVYCEYVYKNLTTDFGNASISAKEEGYEYLLALAVNNIPSDLAITYTVTPFRQLESSSDPLELGKAKNYSIDRKMLQSAPKLENGILESVKEFTTDYERYYYSSVTLSDYNNYVERLASYGYTLYDENNFNGNVYKTFVSDFIVLHVYYTPYSGTISILTSDIKNWTPYDTSPVADKTVTTPVFAMASMDYDADGDGTYNHNNGMGFVFTMADGSYVIIDGGYAADAAPLYQYLQANNKRTDGKILIRAWIITHPDGDHYGCFNEFTAKYANKVTLERFVAQFDYGHQTDEKYGPIISKIYTDAAMYTGCKNIVPLAGQTMYFGTLKIDFLFTAEMFYGYTGEDFIYGSATTSYRTNESSLAFKAYFEDTTILFGADIVGSSIVALTSYYGTTLKCDFFQAPHHALNGSNPLYNYTKPSYLIMCTHKEAANERWNLKKYDSQSKLSYLKNLGVVKQVYVADTAKAEIVPLMVGTTVIPQTNPFS